MTLYMLVTRDEYELPLVVEDTAAALARRIGVPHNRILSSLSKVRHGKNKKSQYVEVTIEDDDDL